MLDFDRLRSECRPQPYHAALHGAWHIDYNGSRFNVIASTFKVVDLMTYADAVGRGQIQPGEAVSLDDWAHDSIGRDGGALAAAYTRFGKPLTVTNDQIVSAMIQESDDAAPDYLLRKLGSASFASIVAGYIAGNGRVGYVDVPQSIGADFALWFGNPADPLSGLHALANYSGFASDEYRAQVDLIFQAMQNANYVNAIRQYEGVQLPWAVGTPPAGQPLPLSEAQYERLESGYFMRSNTRTYNQFMLGLLRRNLLPPPTQAIVEKFLEYRLGLNPPLQLVGGGTLNQYVTRYGSKGGSLATVAGAVIRTQTVYLESVSGTQAVVTIHLNGTPGSATDLGPVPGPLGSLDSAVSYFALALATNPTFAAQVQASLGAKRDAPAPSLIARVVQNTSTSFQARLKVAITNIGTSPTPLPLTISLYISDDATTHGAAADTQTFPRLNPGATAEVDLAGIPGANPGGDPKQWLQLVIDPNNVIPAGQKQDSPQFEILPAGSESSITLTTNPPGPRSSWTVRPTLRLRPSPGPPAASTLSEWARPKGVAARGLFFHPGARAERRPRPSRFLQTPLTSLTSPLSIN